MPASTPMSRAAAWLTLAVSLVIFVLCWISEASNTLLAGRDLSIAHWFAGHRKHLASLSLDASALTAPAVVAGVALVVAVLLWFLRHRRDACLLALATLSAVGVTEVAKKVIGRSRPAAPINLRPETEASFPSGHVLVVSTVVLVAVYLLWPHLTKAWRAWSVALATVILLGMGLIRLIPGQHWFSDVVASYAVACAILAFVALVDSYTRKSAVS